MLHTKLLHSFRITIVITTPTLIQHVKLNYTPAHARHPHDTHTRINAHHNITTQIQARVTHTKTQQTLTPRAQTTCARERPSARARTIITCDDVRFQSGGEDISQGPRQ